MVSILLSHQQIPVDDMVTAVESGARLLGINSAEASELRSKSVDVLKKCKPPKSNNTPGERDAIRSLKENQDIMVVPADKGRAVVVLNTSDYKEKAAELLSDQNTYVKLKGNPTTKYKNKLIKILQELKRSQAISEIKYKQLYPTSEEVPKFYGLPKVHKANIPLLQRSHFLQHSQVYCRSDSPAGWQIWTPHQEQQRLSEQTQ